MPGKVTPPFRACSVLVGVVSLLISTIGCSSNASDGAVSGEGTGKARGHYKIVTTCGMVTDIVRIVAGDKANVVGLLGEGVDPHLYKPFGNDTKELMSADVIFYSGLMLEGRMADEFARIGRNGKPVYAVTEGIDESYLREPPEFSGHYDPHVWMDVSAWSRCVEFVAKSLSEFDPPNASYYQANAKSYSAQLKDLDNYVRRVIASIPKDQRVLVTAHDAFGYFSRAYDIPVSSVQGITTDSEPGVDDINKLVNFLVERKVRAIFVESSVPPRNLQAVVEGAEKQSWKVAVGGKLFSDAMGKGGTYEGTYLGMMDHNATMIARALGGEAPARGFQGKLSEQNDGEVTK